MSLLTSFQALGRRRRGLAAGAATLGATALAIGLTVAPASASTYEGTFLLKNDTTGGNWCLASSNGNVYGATCNSADPTQQWDWFASDAYQVNGEWTLNARATGTGNCLDGNGAGAVYTTPCNSGNTYQNWSEGGQGAGYTMQSYQTGLCLNINPSGGAINAIACNWNNLNENWQFVAAS
jgi:Ricin-type beta-trefoil lectin domain